MTSPPPSSPPVPTSEQLATWELLVHEGLSQRQVKPNATEVQRLTRALARLHSAAAEAIEATRVNPVDGASFTRTLDGWSHG